MTTSASSSSSGSSLSKSYLDSIRDEFTDLGTNLEESKGKIGRVNSGVYYDEIEQSLVESAEAEEIGLELLYRGWSGEELPKKGANRFYQNGSYVFVFTKTNYEKIKSAVFYWKQEMDYLIKLHDKIDIENPENPINLKKCYEELKLCYKETDDEKFASSLKALAESSNALAKYRLGEFFLKGTNKIIGSNYEEAFKLCKKSAEKGYVVALTNLGRCYEREIGTKKDLNMAFKCFSDAAEKGYFVALRHLQRCYHQGIGTERDEKHAFECCQKAAEQKEHPNFLQALKDLIERYMEGIGIEADPKKAFELLNQAAVLGDEEAKFYLQHLKEMEKKNEKSLSEWFNTIPLSWSSIMTQSRKNSIKHWLITPRGA